MAQIPTNLLKNWKDGDVVKAADYKLDRDSIVVAHNDTDSKITTIGNRVTTVETKSATNETNIASLQTSKTDKTGNHEGSWQGLNPSDFDSGQQAIDLAGHKKDYVVHSGFATTTGSANAYTITLSPAPTAYTNGMNIVLDIHTDSTGAATINVNGLGVKPLKTQSGKDAKLKTGIYSFRYKSSTGNFILQGEGSDPEALIITTNSILGS